MKQLVRSILAKMGYQLVRTPVSLEPSPKSVPSNPLDCFFSTLRELNFQPTHILDVGANRGIWTRRALHYFPHCAYTLIEPQEQLKSDVADLLELNPKIQWITAGAGDENKTLKFTLCDRDDSSNFRFSSEAANAQGFQQIEVEILTLNDVINRFNLSTPEMVKIDTEGFDLKVISGASELIGKTEIFLLESAVCAKEIENTLARNIATMQRLGYVPFDITDLNRSPKYGVLWLCEVAFIKETSLLLKSITSYK
jgi:FkbM family methyltransferase